jgi:hypothetical protein
MYYRIKQQTLSIQELLNKLKGELEPNYKVYFKKGSNFKFLQFIGRKDSVIIRKNSLHGKKMYLVQTQNYCDINISEYVPSGFIRNNPIPLGIWGILIPLFNRIDTNKFEQDVLSVLNSNFSGQIRE